MNSKLVCVKCLSVTMNKNHQMVQEGVQDGARVCVREKFGIIIITGKG